MFQIKCSHFGIRPKLKMLERAIGFEPMMIGFADQRLKPLGYARDSKLFW